MPEYLPIGAVQFGKRKFWWLRYVIKPVDSTTTSQDKGKLFFCLLFLVVNLDHTVGRLKMGTY